MAQLKAKQIRVPGLSNNGQPKEILLSNEVTGKLHLWSTGGNVWVSQTDLLNALAELIFEKKPEEGKHAAG